MSVATKTTPVTSMPASLRSFIEAAADTVAREIATLRREALQERAAREAAYVLRLGEIDTLRATLAATNAALEARIAGLKDGASVTLEDVAPVIEGAVASAVGALPVASPGRDADPAVIAAQVAAAVAALPPAAPGKDAEPEVIAKMVQAAVAALPPAAKGDPGPPGKMPIVSEWSEEVHYEGDVVTHEGATYQALKDTARVPGHAPAEWICLAARGGDGQTFTIRGTWQEGTKYKSLEVVSLNGASFAAWKDDPGPCPGDGWQLIAQQGKPGKPGTSIKGDRGPAVPVTGMAINDEGLLTLTNVDGSVVTCDLYPLLVRLK